MIFEKSARTLDPLNDPFMVSGIGRLAPSGSSEPPSTRLGELAHEASAAEKAGFERLTQRLVARVQDQQQRQQADRAARTERTVLIEHLRRLTDQLANADPDDIAAAREQLRSAWAQAAPMRDPWAERRLSDAWAEASNILEGRLRQSRQQATEVKKIAAYAETYNLTVQPHNCHGPIATAAAAQLDACMTNFFIQELVPFRDQIAYDLVHEPLEPLVKDGHMPIPTGPGLGVTLNEGLVGRCPHIRIE